MSETFGAIQELVRRADVRISEHGYDELATEGIMAGDILDGVQAGVVLENYPDYAKGPCVLVLQKDLAGDPIHTVWGIPAGKTSPAVLVTAYRPTREKWSDGFRRRK